MAGRPHAGRGGELTASDPGLRSGVAEPLGVKRIYFILFYFQKLVFPFEKS
jgi:hypothetical protein